ncbi:hypothetical protein [Photobacterium galatheae]|uniref:Uncharacterized protein n=1 Tax=Photobacterium galatheae TaxID=1654360 RepID=A0A066RSX1_9GAMM|nr:hypothetical protein [Photobacterium galatheae]KDM93464.1 hypothetical protein EA58_00945 [Photobacterium galatheae]MCM0147044.1 hypothetical protein [Photobacterium galatheae]
MKKVILALLALTSFSVNAASQSGVITGYIPYSNANKEIIIFQLENNVAQGCNVTGRFAMDNTSPRYQATLSAVLAAYHAKSRIRVNYLDTCNAWGNSADVSFICVGDVGC